MYQASSHAQSNRVWCHFFSRVAQTAFLAALVAVVSPPIASLAITISIEPSPEDENPSWDPTGSILAAHFQAAVNIWESLLPGPGDFSFDFHWEDDLDVNTLAQTSGGIIGEIDKFIEVNSNRAWFADATPEESSEFNF